MFSIEINSLREKPDTFPKNKQVAKRGGRVAGNARRETENELGQSIISKQNFLEKPNDEEIRSIE
jgi:DNA-damage-inducible protein D